MFVHVVISEFLKVYYMISETGGGSGCKKLNTCAKTQGMQNVTLTFITNTQRSKVNHYGILHEALI